MSEVITIPNSQILSGDEKNPSSNTMTKDPSCLALLLLVLLSYPPRTEPFNRPISTFSGTLKSRIRATDFRTSFNSSRRLGEVMMNNNHPIIDENDLLMSTGAAAATTPSSSLPPQAATSEQTMIRIPWTIADLFSEPPTLAVFYHCVGTCYDIFTPAGALLGAIGYPIFFSSTTESSSFYQIVANSGLIVGFSGMGFGIFSFVFATILRNDGEEASRATTPLPWNPRSCIMDRKHRLAINSKVRALDAGTYAGLFVGAIVVAILGGPTEMNLRDGVLGILQALTLGAAAGSILTMGYIALISYKSSNYDNNNNSSRA